MTKITLQPSLFPQEKGDFDSGHFMSLVTRYPQFESWLRMGFLRAYEHLSQIGCPLCKRVKSSNLREFAFYELAESLPTYSSISSQIEVIQSKSGNQKNFFSFGGYLFILKKEDVTTNSTQMNFKIQNQEMDAHVISVEYVVSPMQDSIISLKLVYYTGTQSVFSYDISLSSLINSSDELTEVVEVTPIRPKLSHKALDKNAVG